MGLTGAPPISGPSPPGRANRGMGNEKKAVQVRDEAGKLRYRGAMDDGISNVLPFPRGGFLTREQIARERWTIEPLDDSPGWEKRQDWPQVWKG